MVESVLAGCFGLVIGSFLNVVIARLPARRSLVRPGSHCPSCQASIRWFDNVPILAWTLWLRGKCRSCKAPISPRYPLIEALTALLFIAVVRRFGLSPLTVLRDWPFVGLCIAVTFIDLDHRIIPDELSLGGLAWGLLSAFLAPRPGLLDAWIGAAVGFFGFYLFSWAYWRLTKRVGLGGGDVKLLAMIGAFVGPSGVFLTVLVSSILGSVIGITWALARREEPVLKTAIPYGPFLVLGALADYLLHDFLWHPFLSPM